MMEIHQQTLKNACAHQRIESNSRISHAPMVGIVVTISPNFNL